MYLETVSLKKLLRNTLSYHTLEFGCGMGCHTDYLASISRQVLATGFSERLLDDARRINTRPNIELKLIDMADDWLFLNQKTNLIVCTHVLEFIENVDLFFARAFDALEPGGLLYICESYSLRQMLEIKTVTEQPDASESPARHIHHASDFFDAGKQHHFSCEEFHEWFDDDDRSMTPRLISFLFKRP